MLWKFIVVNFKFILLKGILKILVNKLKMGDIIVLFLFFGFCLYEDKRIINRSLIFKLDIVSFILIYKNLIYKVSVY